MANFDLLFGIPVAAEFSAELAEVARTAIRI